MTKKEEHIHKYRKDVLGKDYEIYRCVLPGCNHYISSQLIRGKFSICWRCGEPFVIKIKHAKPHCDDCVAKKKPIVTESFVLKILGGSE